MWARSSASTIPRGRKWAGCPIPATWSTSSWRARPTWSGGWPWSPTAPRSAGEQLARAAIGRRVAQLGHGPGFDLADALPSQAEVFADLVEGAGLTPVETEAQSQDLPLALVEGDQHLGHL